MYLVQNYIHALEQYITISGRMSRKSYWSFWLTDMIIANLLIIPCILVGDMDMLLIYIVLTTLPRITACIRRLHDIDKSGWWLLLCLIPIIGIVFLAFLIMRGTPDDNRFGPVPT